MYIYVCMYVCMCVYWDGTEWYKFSSTECDNSENLGNWLLNYILSVLYQLAGGRRCELNNLNCGYVYYSMCIDSMVAIFIAKALHCKYVLTRLHNH